jgi:hypothetical protein
MDEASSESKEGFPDRIVKVDVVGTVLDLGHCFDFESIAHIKFVICTTDPLSQYLNEGNAY